MSDLPSSWAWSTVGDLTTVQLGRQRSPKNHTGPHMRPYLRSANVTWNGIDVSDVKEMNFAPDEAKTFELVDGDILLNEASGSPGEVGKPAIWRGEIPGACFQNTLLRVRSSGPDDGYLFWYFYASALSGRFGEAGRGVNIRHLGKQGLTSFKIPVPPLPEQRRIVAAIEEHFSRLDAADASLSAAGIRAERLPAAACGWLTRGDWPRRPLIDILSSLRNGAFVSRPAAEPPGAPILRISSVRQRTLDVSDVRYASPPPKNSAHYKVSSGDILFTRYSGNPKFVGACAVVPESGHGLLHPDKLIRGVPRLDVVDPHWIAAYLSIGEGRASIEKRLKTTAGQIGISGSQLKTVEVPVPPLNEQRELLQRIEEFDVLGSIAKPCAAVGARRSNALRRSILAAAFSGQLVDQDPSDESASLLVERIAAERRVEPPRRKRVAP